MADHALIVKTHWKSGAARLRVQLGTSQQEAEKQATDPRDVFAIRAGIEAYVARAALELLGEVLEAAEDAEGALPIPLLRGQHMILDGRLLRVVGAWEEVDRGDGRVRWDIVTEAEEQPDTPADATAPQERCKKCAQPFDPTDAAFDGRAQHRNEPFCRGCVDHCHDTEIADHWCEIDRYRTK